MDAGKCEDSWEQVLGVTGEDSAPKNWYITFCLRLGEHRGRGGRKDVRSQRISHCNHELKATADACTGSAQEQVQEQSSALKYLLPRDLRWRVIAFSSVSTAEPSGFQRIVPKKCSHRGLC